MDYKIIRKIHHKIQANMSTIKSELGGVQHGILGMAIQPGIHQTVIEHDLSPWPVPHKQIQCQKIWLQLKLQGTSRIMWPKWNNDAKW